MLEISSKRCINIYTHRLHFTIRSLHIFLETALTGNHIKMLTFQKETQTNNQSDQNQTDTQPLV